MGGAAVTIEVQWGEMDALGHEPALYARGTSVAVLVDYRSMKKVRVPDDVRVAIEAL